MASLGGLCTFGRGGCWCPAYCRYSKYVTVMKSDTRQPHQEDVFTSSTDAHKELPADIHPKSDDA
jgi:hypothetical protein